MGLDCLCAGFHMSANPTKTILEAEYFQPGPTKVSLGFDHGKVPCTLKVRAVLQEEEEEGEEEEAVGSCLSMMKEKKGIHQKVPKGIHQQEQDLRTSRSKHYVALLKASAEKKDLKRGCIIHAEITTMKFLQMDVFVGSALINMYVKCGSLSKAQDVLDNLVVRDVVAWSTLITGYADQGYGEKALNCFQQMQLEGISPNAVTYLSSLKACGSLGAIGMGQALHAEIARKGLLDKNVFVGTALIDMYAKCGLLAKAQEVFDNLPFRNVVSWGALIAGYTQHGGGTRALDCCEQMQLEGIAPNPVIYVSSLKACGSIAASGKGQEIHAEIVCKGLLETNNFIGNALVDMYAKCGLLIEAQNMFNRLQVQDLVAWNVLIAGYAQHGHGEEALTCFEQMQLDSMFPDAVTYVCGLKACAGLGAMDKGQELHAEIARQGLQERNVFVGNALVHMYAKCGLLAKAQGVFDGLPMRDVISWSALITGYTDHGHGEKALHYLQQMQLEGVCPNGITYLCSLKACGIIGAIDRGQELHTEITSKGLLEIDSALGTALVDMYAKFGLLAKAKDLFDKLPVRNLVSWNSLITGFAQVGETEDAFHTFNRLIEAAIKPDQVTFIGLLAACSHAGLVNEGQLCFESMSKEYGLIPTLEHYTCMSDLLGRAGQLDNSVLLIKKMPIHSDPVVWHTLLSASHKWGNMNFGREAFENIVGLNERDSAAYVCMSNMYSDNDEICQRI